MAKISESQVKAIKAYLKNPDNHTIYKDKKFVDNMELSKLVRKLFNLTDAPSNIHGINKLLVLKKENPELFKGFDVIKGDIYKRDKPLIKALQNDPVFKDIANKKVKELGKKDFFELKKDQQNTIKGTVAKVKKDVSILPKNYITKPQLAKKLGMSEVSLEKYGMGLKAEIGDKYKEIFKPVVLKNRGTFFDTTNLDSKIKKFNEFRDRPMIHNVSKDRAKMFADNVDIQKLLDTKNKTLFSTDEGLKLALKTLGKGSTPYEAASAMTILGRAYKGEKFRGLDVAKNFVKGQFIFRNMADLRQENPWTMGLYDEGLRQVDRDLGNKINTFKKFKKDYTYKMNKILKDLGITSKFNINEITSVKASFNNKLAPYAAFVDITQADINQKVLGSFQGDLSKTLAYLDKNKNSQAKILDKIERFNTVTRGKRKGEVIKKFGEKAGEDVRLTEIIAGTNVESIYDPQDLEKWKESGLDLKKLAKEKGYFLDVKGARPYFELTLAEEINKGNPQFKKLIENRVGCAEGCLAKVANEEPGKITRALKSIKNFFVSKPDMPSVKYDDTLGAFVDTKTDNIASQAELKTWAHDNPMEVKVGEAKPGILRKTGKALAHLGLPLPTAALDAYFVGRQIEEGKSPTEIAKDPFNWLGLATMDPLTKAAGMADKSGKLASVLRLGMSPGLIRGASRFLGIPGLIISTGLTAYDQYNKYQNEEGFIYNLFNDKKEVLL